jgi:hypothetical protein
MPSKGTTNPNNGMICKNVLYKFLKVVAYSVACLAACFIGVAYGTGVANKAKVSQSSTLLYNALEHHDYNVLNYLCTPMAKEILVLRDARFGAVTSFAIVKSYTTPFGIPCGAEFRVTRNKEQYLEGFQDFGNGRLIWSPPPN